MPTLIIFGVLAIVWVICMLGQDKSRPNQYPSDAETAKWGVPVDPDGAAGGGWSVEVDGRPIALLSEARCQLETPHWLSYVITPLTEDAQERAQLLTLQFWHSDRPKYRSRRFGVIASGALVSGIPPCPHTHRLIMRGPYVQLDPGPSLVERVIALFKKRDPGKSHD
jgi:hypothetical protein